MCLWSIDDDVEKWIVYLIHISGFIRLLKKIDDFGAKI